MRNDLYVCRYMHWSWHDLRRTPQHVVAEVYRWLEEQAEQAEMDAE